METGTPEITSDLLVIALPHWNSLRDRTLHTLEDYHEQYPYRRGIPREELKSRLKISARVFNALVALLITQQSIQEVGNWLAMPGHTVTFRGQDQIKVQELSRRFEQNPYSPPSVKESQAQVGEDILSALVEAGQFIIVSTDVIFRKPDYDSAVTKIQESLKQTERITLSEVRDLLNTSRKYAQALLEHMDAIGLTAREGDYRKLKKK
jgi:selenocysteine-specific elongation factor